MDIAIAGGLVRFVQGVFSALPTLLVGLLIAALLRYYLRADGTVRLFGGSGLRSLAQSWLVGMLLPVCSIGVIPIIREMRRIGMRPGAISAFALSAPLFNPLSLLYGLTLSRPYVIIGFALGSLAVVTVLGMVWDRVTRWSPHGPDQEKTPVSLRRLGFTGLLMIREIFGPTGVYSLIALSGLFFLGGLLPHGTLQSSVEQDNWWAPLNMTAVVVPVYATPMLTMSQLGMMFTHGNSPGAAFCLLLLGTGVNLGTLVWISINYGWRPTLIWFSMLLAVVVGIAYLINEPLIPPGVQPAGHTHAFDIYTNPFASDAAVGLEAMRAAVEKSISPLDLYLGGTVLLLMAVAGLLTLRLFRRQVDQFLMTVPELDTMQWEGIHRKVSGQTVGITLLIGLIALSIVGCYAYYPPPSEVLEEIRLVRVEVLSGISSRNFEQVQHHIPDLERWSRMLEVGYFLRNFQLRPYQQMQAYLLRKKLELLEHAAEEIVELQAQVRAGNKPASELEEKYELANQLRVEISENLSRLSQAFR
jgi:uncharacterized membrane protein YraQ (UPF0718 family)